MLSLVLENERRKVHYEDLQTLISSWLLYVLILLEWKKKFSLSYVVLWFGYCLGVPQALCVEIKSPWENVIQPW
jgi:hypothetical protein